MLVQNRVAIAEPRLPEDVRRLGVTTLKSSPDLLMVIHLISPDNAVRPALHRQLRASFRSATRWPASMAWATSRRSASASTACGSGSIRSGWRTCRSRRATWFERCASRTCKSPPASSASRRFRPGNDFQLSVNTLGRLLEPEQFENIIVKTGDDGRVIKVQGRGPDRARRPRLRGQQLSRQRAGRGAWSIAQRPGSNALATAEGVEADDRRAVEEISRGLEYRIVYNPTVFVRESINSVIHTLFEAVILVVIVVLVFLQNWRATLIPLMAIPVSLIGTFAAMAAFGFSLNMLSLFGLVLAIGIVVDDAIVVVENVERHIAAGLSPRDGGAQSHGRSHRRRHRDRGRTVGGVRADGVHRRHHGPVLPAIRADDRGVHAVLGLQLADAQLRPCARSCCSRTAPRRIGSAGCGISRSAGSSGCSTAASIGRATFTAGSVGWVVRRAVVAACRLRRC